MLAGHSEPARPVVAYSAGGLSDRDRELLDLTYRHGLDVPEVAMVLGVTLAAANTMVLRLRQTVGRRLGPLLVARGRHACPERGAPVFLPAPDWLRSRTLNAVRIAPQKSPQKSVRRQRP